MTKSLKKTKETFNRGNLKMIALFCMTLDHFAVMIFDSWMKLYDKTSIEYALISTPMIAFRLIGRMAFPIFCFFIVEGLFHTRSVFKYSLRLLLLAFISEVPFDMVLKHTFWDIHYQNVFWTLFLGLITIYAVDGILKKIRSVKALRYILAGLTAVSGIYLAEFLGTDYGSIGVLTIVLIYLIGEEQYLFAAIVNVLGQTIELISFKESDILKIVLGAFSIVAVSFAIYICRRITNVNSRKMLAGVAALSCLNFIELSALINMKLFEYYDGEKGKNIGWFFYFFYPAHLLILAGFAKLVGLY